MDAPCSGEGMFRKVHSITKNWMQYGSGYYADIQRSILPEAVKMLRPGGYMLFSTCTFSKKEDEESLKFILEKFPEMETVPSVDFEDEAYKGFAHGYDGYTDAIRIYPHKCKGEGHFAVLLRKKNDVTEDAGLEKYTDQEDESEIVFKNEYDKNSRKKYREINEETFDFFENLKIEIPINHLRIKDGKVCLIPEGCPDLRGLRILRSGLFLGEIKQGRFEPSQALALALKKEQYHNILDLDINDERVIRYLKCESIGPDEDRTQNGLCLVCVNGYPLGWGKVDKGRLKNKYLSSWRML